MPVAGALAFQPLMFDVPNGDASQAKVVNLGPLIWSQQQVYTFDFSTSNQLLEMQNIQSAFVDNYTNNTVTLTVGGTGHVIRIPPKSQAFMPLLITDRLSLTISSSGASGQSQVWIMNVPALGVVWTLP